MTALAFCTPLPLSFHHRESALNPSKRRPIRSTKRVNRSTTPSPPISLSRTRIDPRDEAFITCSSCGYDTPISASAITAKGSLSVRCEGCGVRFTALAERALTITGRSLAAIAPVGDDEERDPNAGIVNLYVGGLAPKTDTAALKAAFEEFGEVVKANVVYDRVTGRSRGFGFVSIVGKSAASAAMDVLSGDATRLGRRLNVREAIDR